MARKNTKAKIPDLCYKVAEGVVDEERINAAFDVLFEEVEKMGNSCPQSLVNLQLTPMDN